MALFILNNTLARGAARYFTSTRSILPKVGFECVAANKGTQLISRSLWHLNNTYSSNNTNNKLCIPKHITFSNSCSCGCSKVHTKGDQELVQFLTDEIDAETKSQKHPKLPKIEGFDVKTDGSSVVLTKSFQNENIKVKLNVNHTVDSLSHETPVTPTDTQPAQDKPEMTNMKSKPGFTVEIEKGENTIGFSCSFVEDYTPEEADDPDAFNDIFNIDEVVFHKGEWNESTYSVSGDIIDGYLYDLLMNTLEERGISTEFAEKLIEFCTSYEHKLYINLLESLKTFINSGK